MKLLLDTHVLVWSLIEPSRVPERAARLITDESNEVYWSAASSWELAIKSALGRIRFAEPVARLIPRVLLEQSIRSLPVEQSHALAVADLDLHHRDPFDRLLVAQCKLEKLALVSGDARLDAYGIERRW